MCNVDSPDDLNLPSNQNYVPEIIGKGKLNYDIFQTETYLIMIKNYTNDMIDVANLSISVLNEYNFFIVRIPSSSTGLPKEFYLTKRPSYIVYKNI